MKRLIGVLMLVPAVALAQQPSPTNTEKALTFEMQRCMQDKVGADAQILNLQDQVANLQKELDGLKAKPEAPKK